MGGHVNSVWTDEQAASLMNMLANGLSYAQIAAELNAKFNTNFSRNAACGKGFRLGLNAPQKAKVARKPRKRREPREISNHTPRVTKPRIEEIQLRCAAIEPRHLTLCQLEPNDCRYPFGEGPFTFCGHPVKGGSSYCQSHFHLSLKQPYEISDAVSQARARRMRSINYKHRLATRLYSEAAE